MKITFRGKTERGTNKQPITGAIIIRDAPNKKINESASGHRQSNKKQQPRSASGEPTTATLSQTSTVSKHNTPPKEQVRDELPATIKNEPPDEPPKDEVLNEPVKKEDKKARKSRLYARDLTKNLKLQNYGLNDAYFDTFQPQNIGKTIFPLNTPCYLAGQKGSGKTYLLASIIQYAYKEQLISRLFYIYADNVDSTIARAIPRSKMYAIPKVISTEFLMKFLRKKTKFTSCMNFTISYDAMTKNNTKAKEELGSVKLEEAPLYFDNLLDQITKNKRIFNVGGLKQYADRVINKYKKGTQLTFSGKYSYNLGRFTVNDYDFIVLDDIAQFADLFGTTRNNSQLYPYFTITRQNKTTFYLTGQEVKQLPKMFREMLGAIVLLNGVNMSDISELKLDSSLVTLFRNEFQHLKNYEGIVYNYNDKEYEIIKN